MTEISPPENARRDRLIFYPVAALGGLFCLSIFICIAATFGDPEVPLNQWITRNFTSILLGEAGVVLVVGFAAMTVDRLITLRERRQPPSLVEDLDREGAGNVD